MQNIFIHGLGQDSSSWEKTILLLPESSQNFCPDLWLLLHNTEFTYANLYSCFQDYCNGIPGSLNLCGLSLGAILALNFALEYPEKVQSLVLIGAQYKMPKGLLKFQNIIFRFLPRAVFTKMGIQKNNVIKLTNSMIDLDFSAKLKDVLCNTLIVCGEKDEVNRKAAQIFIEQVPNAEFHLIKNVGHEVNKEASQNLATTLNAFWGMSTP